MRLADFFALRTGVAPLGVRACLLSVRDAGALTVTSGTLELADPINFGEGFVTSVPRGTHPVRLTIADVSERLDGSHLRVAFLSLLLRTEPPAALEPVTPEGKPAPEPGAAYCIPVDCGTVGLADAVEAKRISDAPSEQTSEWFEREVFAERDYHEAADYVAPQHIPLFGATAGENYVTCPAGWGDGRYTVWATRDDGGELTGIHVDFEVVVDPSADYAATD
jgi:Protein of unknown function (DUF4241)